MALWNIYAGIMEKLAHSWACYHSNCSNKLHSVAFVKARKRTKESIRNTRSDVKYVDVSLWNE